LDTNQRNIRFRDNSPNLGIENHILGLEIDEMNRIYYCTILNLKVMNEELKDQCIATFTGQRDSFDSNVFLMVYIKSYLLY
jgi:hypothetical protein